ncbi:MAG: hypothetical protein KDE35_06875 [Geminicoccaceae bacterium]|nr:hypothetical protein [Geminicoccaceae bacterium]
MTRDGRHLGITVMPEWIQSEGIEGVLRSLARAGATAVATSPYVMARSDAADAGREPPIDADAGKVRLLDRDLWGAREIRCTTAPSYVPDLALYDGLRYRPSAPTDLTRSQGPLVGRFLEAAAQAGLETHLQVQAAIPPGYRVQFGGPEEDDKPRLPDGSLHEGRVDKNASLASPQVVAYVRALLRDLARAYPMIDAVRIDWPEYPPYSLDSWFFDFNTHAVRTATARGYDVARMRRDAAACMRDPSIFVTRGAEIPTGFCRLQDFKAELSLDLVRACRDALPASLRLVAHAFPPPWARLSGMDLHRVGAIADDVALKLYTMHWPMMLDGYARRIEAAGCRMARPEILARLQELFDTGEAPAERMRYPEPEEAHPVSAASQRRKIETAAAELGGAGATLTPAAHSYGPTEDALARIRTAFEAGRGRVWINRYGYMSDAKLDGVGRMMREG